MPLIMTGDYRVPAPDNASDFSAPSRAATPPFRGSGGGGRPSAMNGYRRQPPRPVPQPFPDPEPSLPGSGADRLMQLGAGGEVTTATPPDPFAVVTRPTTRMSPAGMPCASTVTEPSLDLPIAAPILTPIGDTTGGAGLGQPASTGTTTTWPSPS